MAEPIGRDTVIRFRLVDLVVFGVALVIAGGVLSIAVVAFWSGPNLSIARAARPSASATSDGEADNQRPRNLPAWGELAVREVELERPEEYIGFEISQAAPTWVFANQTPDQARKLLLTAGVDDERTERALSTEATGTDTGTTVTPDEELLLALSPQTRARLYHELGRSAANRYLHDPFRSHTGDIDRWFADTDLGPAIVAMTKRLLYPCGQLQCFSDYELVLHHLGSDAQRVTFAKTLSRQRALMVRLRVRPDTDVNKLLGYWSVAGVHQKDLRPLIESLKRLPKGGSISITFALPPFARQRLYTYPTPDGSTTTNPSIDCHWSTLNFFNDVPDDRFSSPAYAVPFIRDHYYQVAEPSRYGDRIFLIDKAGNALHSAVYIADDIVFTKNGYGVGQPWMLMHLKDMQDSYGYAGPLTVTVYRDRAN